MLCYCSSYIFGVIQYSLFICGFLPAKEGKKPIVLCLHTNIMWWMTWAYTEHKCVCACMCVCLCVIHGSFSGWSPGGEKWRGMASLEGSCDLQCGHAPLTVYAKCFGLAAFWLRL